MRFDPKIVRLSETPLEASGQCWNDEEFETRLPGDLEMLAAQLRDDATYLSSRFPASEPNCIMPLVKESAAQASPRHSGRVWLVAGSLASVALLVSAALPWVIPGDSSKAGRAVNDNKLRTGTRPDVGLHRVARDGDTRDRVAQGTAETADSHELRLPASGSVPALFLQNVSGPELEGLFDLWEADAVEQSRISI